MTAQSRPGSGAGKAFLYMLVGLVLWAAVGLFLRNSDRLIDRFGLYLDWRAGIGLAVAVFVAAVFWIQGHRVYATSKGRSALIGLALAFLPIVGLLILIAMPSRAKSEAAPEPAPEP